MPHLRAGCCPPPRSQGPPQCTPVGIAAGWGAGELRPEGDRLMPKVFRLAEPLPPSRMRGLALDPFVHSSRCCPCGTKCTAYDVSCMACDVCSHSCQA